VIRGEVVRQQSRPDGTGTPGRMALENGFSCDTLELGWHNNERGRSCTAPGVDRGKVWYSPTLRRMVVRYEDRNGRRDCLIHNGNWAGDEAAGLKTQVHGCTEVGHGYGEVQRPDGVKQWGILVSGATLAGLIDSLKCSSAEADTVIDGQGFHDVEMTYRWA
jgi:hypothetical protein